MPFTPYHFGPGLLLKTVFQRHFSFTSFVATNVVIDVETLYYLVTRQYPVHRQMHTFLGSILTGLAVAGLLLLVFRWLASNDVARLWDSPSPWVQAEFNPVGVLAGGLVGGASHTVLDSVMHRDLVPFGPVTDWNPFLGVIGLDALHLGCVIAGVVAIAVAGIQSMVAKQAG